MSALWWRRRRSARACGAARARNGPSARSRRARRRQQHQGAHDRDRRLQQDDERRSRSPSTQTSRPSEPCSALSIDSCICSGATRTSTSIAISGARERDVVAPVRERREEVEQRDLAPRPARLAPAGRDPVSRATPVNEASTVAHGTAIRPAAGSMMTMSLRVTRSRTTK